MAPNLAPRRNLAKIDMYSELVGMAGFEPAASCSQSRRANQAAPHPADRSVAYRPARPRLGLSPWCPRMPWPRVSELDHRLQLDFGAGHSFRVRCRCSPGGDLVSTPDPRA